MKHLITLIIISLLSLTAYSQVKTKSGKTYNAVITRVIDGDTIAIEAKWLPDPLKKELSIRVYGVDTPEKGFRAKCAKENKLGLDASDFTKSAVKHAAVTQIVIMDWDKYGGRVLGDVLLDGVSLRQMLLDQHYAREYYGAAKQSWCD